MPSFSKLPPQVFRLILLAVGIVVFYSAARYFLTPRSFHQYGFFRGEALAEIASRPVTFAGRKACDECHSEQIQQVLKGSHKTLSCEGCHGPGQAHVENPDVKLEVLNYSHCVRCHEASPSRPKWHKQIVLKDHYTSSKSTGSKCSECHVPHSPADVP